jgi:ribose 5-phosphate isomerase RpiB
VKTWLATDFGGGRHARRVDKIAEIEKRFKRSE